MGITGSFTGFAAQMAGFQKSSHDTGWRADYSHGAATTGMLPTHRLFSTAFFPTTLGSQGVPQTAQNFKSSGVSHPGAAAGLLPCGPIYTALIASARSGMEAGSPGPAR